MKLRIAFLDVVIFCLVVGVAFLFFADIKLVGEAYSDGALHLGSDDAPLPAGTSCPVNCWPSRNGVWYSVIVDYSVDPAKIFLVGSDGSVFPREDVDPGADFVASVELPPDFSSKLTVRISANGNIEYEEVYEEPCEYEGEIVPCVHRSLCVKRASGITMVIRYQRFIGQVRVTDIEMYGEDGSLDSRDHTEMRGWNVIRSRVEEFEDGQPIRIRIVGRDGRLIVEYFFEAGVCVRIVETEKDVSGVVVRVIERDCEGNILRQTDYSDGAETITETLFGEDGTVTGYRVIIRTGEGEQVEYLDAEGRPAREKEFRESGISVLGSKFAAPIVRFY